MKIPLNSSDAPLLITMRQMEERLKLICATPERMRQTKHWPAFIPCDSVMTALSRRGCIKVHPFGVDLLRRTVVELDCD